MNKTMTLGILAHVDAGKTTLSEGFLYLSGAVRKLGRVDHRDTFLDTHELERKRGITIFSKQAVFDYEGTRFTLLDTPGHADFSPEMERTLNVLDAAILMISAADGVTAQVKLLWKLLGYYGVPTFIFVNKMDRSHVGKDSLLREINADLGSHCISFENGIEDSAVQEELAMCDDELLASYLDGKRISKSDIRRLIRSCRCCPCLFGSALKMDGVKELLSLINEYFPAKEYDPAASFGARVFKISRDEAGKRLAHIKITSGTLKVRDLIGDEKVDQIRFYSGEKYEAKAAAEAGDVCAVTGLAKVKAGEGIGIQNSIDMTGGVIQPILSSSLILPQDADLAHFYRQLKSLEEEEPALRVSFNEELKEIEVKLMGEVQKEILKHIIKQRFDIDVDFGPGHIVYKETVAEPVLGVGHFEPLRHYAEVHLMIEPMPAGSGISFDTKCSTDALSTNWQRLVLTHLKEKRHVGVLTGSELTDVKITLIAGKAHEKHTEGGDFRQATYRALRQGLMEASMVLLEPVLEYRVEVPGEFVGRVLTDIQKMNGTSSLPDVAGGLSVITGEIPAACLGDYAGEVRTYTHGEGQMQTAFKGYMPCHNADEVIALSGYDAELDADNPSSSVFCARGAARIVPWYEAREHMHIDTGIMQKPRSLNAIEKDITRYKSSEDELKAIFERTYGKIKPRYVENKALYEALDDSGESETDTRDYELEKSKREKHQNGASFDKDNEHKEYLLVDGYNVIYASSLLSKLAQEDLKAARDSLIDILINFQGFRREQVILVFDAYKVLGGTERMENRSGLTVIYTKEAETADQYIEKAAHEIGKRYRVTVATSDAIEQIIVMGGGAYRMSARDFWDEIARTDALISEKLKPHIT